MSIISPKPIETRYAGCRFRSRLEARWAVFFDYLDFKWDYEPEGYDLPSGYYLPDFLLYEDDSQGLWFEVKPETAADPDPDPRWGELTVATSRPILIAYGLPRHDENPGGRVGRGRIGCIKAGKPHPFISTSSPRIVAAYTAARSARFEHGETP
jgi:hypothetical protein